MNTITQKIGELSPILTGRSQEDIMKFLFNQNNNNWRRKNRYAMKRKGLNKKRKRSFKYIMIDETYWLYKELLTSSMKRMRKHTYIEN